MGRGLAKYNLGDNEGAIEQSQITTKRSSLILTFLMLTTVAV